MMKIKINNKKILFGTLLVLALIIGVLLYFQINRNHEAQKPSNTASPEGIVNLNPPTAEERQSGDAAKSKIIEQEKARNAGSPTTPSGKKAVTPSITYASQYQQQVEVGGFISGIFEDGGTCTLTLQKGDKKITAQVTSVKGANSVDCPVMSVPRSSLEAGQWLATVSYTSASAEGQSDAKTVEVK